MAEPSSIPFLFGLDAILFNYAGKAWTADLDTFQQAETIKALPVNQMSVKAISLAMDDGPQPFTVVSPSIYCRPPVSPALSGQVSHEALEAPVIQVPVTRREAVPAGRTELQSLALGSEAPAPQLTVKLPRPSINSTKETVKLPRSSSSNSGRLKDGKRQGKDLPSVRKSRSMPAERSRAKDTENSRSKDRSKAKSNDQPKDRSNQKSNDRPGEMSKDKYQDKHKSRSKPQEEKPDEFGRFGSSYAAFVAIDTHFETHQTPRLVEPSETPRSQMPVPAPAVPCDNQNTSGKESDDISAPKGWLSRISRVKQGMAFDSPDNAVIIFDWDDTLCPTWFLLKGQGAESGGLMDASNQKLLKDHANMVAAILRTARSVARVAVVTLASRSWFQESLAYFSGIDMKDLLDKLCIEVHCAEVLNGAAEEADARMLAKKVSMSKCLNQFYGKGALGPRWNVLSIGDAEEEQRALMSLVKDCWHHPLHPLCKTVKLMQHPDVFELTDQLRLLLPVLPKIMFHSKDLHKSCKDVAKGPL